MMHKYYFLLLAALHGFSMYPIHVGTIAAKSYPICTPHSTAKSIELYHFLQHLAHSKKVNTANLPLAQHIKALQQQISNQKIFRRR